MYWGASLICDNGLIASPYRVPSDTGVMESIKRYHFTIHIHRNFLPYYSAYFTSRTAPPPKKSVRLCFDHVEWKHASAKFRS